MDQLSANPVSTQDPTAAPVGANTLTTAEEEQLSRRYVYNYEETTGSIYNYVVTCSSHVYIAVYDYWVSGSEFYSMCTALMYDRWLSQ